MPPITALFSFQPHLPAILLAVIALGSYIAGIRQVRLFAVRGIVFLLGILFYLFATQGFLGVFAPVSRWVFALKMISLLLFVPFILASARPLKLFRTCFPAAIDNRLGLLRFRFFEKVCAILAKPFIAPLVTFLIFMVVITPASGWLRTSLVGETLVDLLLPLVGLVLVAPIIDTGETTSASLMAFEFVFAFIELLIDAVPGMVLRLNSVILDGLTQVSSTPWVPSPLRDQQLAGDFLVVFCEVADLPLLILLLLRIQKKDHSESKAIDELDDEAYERLNEEYFQSFTKDGS